MHALTVEEEELEGLPPGEVNDREYMAQVSLVIQKQYTDVYLQLQELVLLCLAGNPSCNAVKRSCSSDVSNSVFFSYPRSYWLE